MTNDPLLNLELFFGELTAHRALVYARLPRPDDDAGWTIAGQVRGPRCLYAQTLPLSAPLVDLGAGPTLLARAVVPDPVFWSPDLPAIYDVTVRLSRGGQIIATARRPIGLRWLGVRGTDFVLEGKRWVLRGVRTSSTTATLPRDWHDARAAVVTAQVGGDDLFEEASQFGALAVVEIAGGDAGINELRRLARQPAVALAVVRGTMPQGFSRADAAPNILLGQSIGPDDPPVRQPWADALFAATTDAALLAEAAALGELPVVAVRPLAQRRSIAEARAACDQLQRDLVPLGQFAGYVV